MTVCACSPVQLGDSDPGAMPAQDYCLHVVEQCDRAPVELDVDVLVELLDASYNTYVTLIEARIELEL